MTVIAGGKTYDSIDHFVESLVNEILATPRIIRAWWRIQRALGWSNIRWILKQPYYWHQRARRGWARPDAWNAETHIAKVVAGLCRELEHSKWLGCPSEFLAYYTEETAHDVWQMIVRSIAEGFEAYQQTLVLNYEDPLYWEHKQRYNAAMRLFAMYHANLWD